MRVVTIAATIMPPHASYPADRRGGAAAARLLLVACVVLAGSSRAYEGAGLQREAADFVATGYRHDSNADKGAATATYTA